MPVMGISEAVSTLNNAGAVIESAVKQAIEKGAGIVLDDMRNMTPIDPASGGDHARNGLYIAYDDDGLIAHIGLPDAASASDYFWFRFLDGGTKGGEVRYWRRDKAGNRTRHVMRVPTRPALHIRERAIDGNIDEIRALVRAAIEDALS